jgi:two-component system CheB/CheR fusion protein
LAPIRSAVELLGEAGSSQAELAFARGAIDRQVRQLTRLVDDLLDVSRITQGKIKVVRHPVVLQDVIEHALEMSGPLVEARRQQLTVEMPPEPVLVNGDATRLAQVIGNLLSNAAKFTDEGGRIELRVEVEAGTGADRRVAIRLRDNGIGIEPEMLARMFDPFVQDDRSLDRPYGGLGIGLTLVRSLVQMHDGTVEGYSEGRGRGSEFVMRLPVLSEAVAIKPTETSSPRATVSRATNRAAHRVLVVDDNRDSARSMSLLLRHWGHDSAEAHDGSDALDIAARFQPDAILLDVGLPGMSGYDVARHIRSSSDARLSRALLVAITGYGQDEDRRRTQEAGFDHHLVKPVDPKVVESLLAELSPRGGG